MPAAVVLQIEHADAVADYVAAMRAARRKTGRSTRQAARTFCAKLQRAGGWKQLSRSEQIDAIGKARSFASWLLVTGRRNLSAEVFAVASARARLGRRPATMSNIPMPERSWPPQS